MTTTHPLFVTTKLSFDYLNVPFRFYERLKKSPKVKVEVVTMLKNSVKLYRFRRTPGVTRSWERRLQISRPQGRTRVNIVYWSLVGPDADIETTEVPLSYVGPGECTQSVKENLIHYTSLELHKISDTYSVTLSLSRPGLPKVKEGIEWTSRTVIPLLHFSWFLLRNEETRVETSTQSPG